MNLVPGTQLAQVRPNGTAAVQGLAPQVGRAVEVTRIHISAGATGATATLYQDKDGTTRDATTRIYTVAVAANETEVITAEPGAGITVDASGELGVQTSLADELTFTFWGVVAPITQRR